MVAEEATPVQKRRLTMDTGKVQNDKIQPDDEISNEDIDKVAGGAAILTSRSNIRHVYHGKDCKCARCV